MKIKSISGTNITATLRTKGQATQTKRTPQTQETGHNETARRRIKMRQAKEKIKAKIGANTTNTTATKTKTNRGVMDNAPKDKNAEAQRQKNKQIEDKRRQKKITDIDNQIASLKSQYDRNKSTDPAKNIKAEKELNSRIDTLTKRRNSI